MILCEAEEYILSGFLRALGNRALIKISLSISVHAALCVDSGLCKPLLRAFLFFLFMPCVNVGALLCGLHMHGNFIAWARFFAFSFGFSFLLLLVISLIYLERSL